MSDEKTRVLKATAASFIAAAVIVVTLVLPAEYNLDPLGTGALLGLNGLSTEPAQATLTDESAPPHTDQVEFVLGTFESVEYKYRIDAASSLVYHWQASVPVTFDFHGEPLDGPEGFAETWAKGKDAARQGTFVAPFAGRHGWFFENRTFEPVTVTLSVTGFFDRSLVYRDGFVDVAEWE